MGEENLVLQALFVKATTTVYGGWRISFDCDAQQAQEIIELAKLKDKLLNLVIIKPHG